LKSVYKIFFIVLSLTIMGISCSREKNTFTRRAFHSTTSHYNYYFNANELLRLHLDNISNSYTDDYNYILPIFYYGTEAQATGAYDDMEDIVKKCSKLIDRHSMYLKKKEHNKWIDESYNLIGKAKFYKREFYGAIEIFEYTIYAFADQPTYYEAKIWIARTYLEMEDKREAEDILETIKEVNIPIELRGEYYALLADLQMKEGDKEEATLYLRSAAEKENDKNLKRRYTYILAQIFHELKDYPNATKYYGKVLKMRPDYRMAFNSKLNQARSYDISAGNSDEIKKRLDKLLRDKKNLEFRDQIYFALAELAFREGDEELGMAYLKKSASSSMGNNKVKSEAYMLLGNIYYDKPDYIIAHGYYDSSLTVMPKTHPKLQEISELKKGLDDLVINLLAIIEQDSLQKVAAMDEKERKKIINKIIKDVKKREEQKSQLLAQSFAQSYELANKRDNTFTSGAKWYFYNQSIKSFGVSEFKKVWSERPWEDNWRRSDKSTMAVFEADVADSSALDTLDAGLTNLDPEFYLNRLPLTDSSMAVSHNIIIEALYNAGNIFREQFLDYESALENFNRLVTQYDTSRHVQSSYYQMYRVYLMMEDYEKANQYKNLIITKYPFSEYARIIKNPEYLKNKRDKKEQIEAYYSATYKLYNYGLYVDVIEASGKADSLFGDNHMKPKFDYLRALAIGQSKSKEAFRMALEEVIANHPSDDVAEPAQNILDKMKEISSQKVKREAIYKTNFRDEHIFVVMVPNLSMAVQDAKMAISNYNINALGPGKLKISAVIFNGQKQMISVKSFKNKEEGLIYIDNISKYPDFISNVSDLNYEQFLISTQNYAFFYQQKNLQEYLSFYDDHYLNRK